MTASNSGVFRGFVRNPSFRARSPSAAGDKTPGKQAAVPSEPEEVVPSGAQQTGSPDNPPSPSPSQGGSVTDGVAAMTLAGQSKAAPAHQRGKRAGPSKSAASKQGSSSGAGRSGGTGGTHAATPGSSGAGAAAGAGAGGSGGGGGGGGRRPRKKVPEDAKSTPSKKKRRRTRGMTVTSVEADDAARGREGTDSEEEDSDVVLTDVETVEAIDDPGHDDVVTMATVPTEMQLRKRRSAIRISLVERKRADAALAKDRLSAAMREGLVDPDAAATDASSIVRARPSRFTLSSDEEEELEEAVNTDVRVHEAPTGFPTFMCFDGCTCNKMTRTELRKALATDPQTHKQENLRFLQYVALKNDNNMLRSEVRLVKRKLTKQGQELAEIKALAEKAAQIRQDHLNNLEDKSSLNLPWSTMDEGNEIFGDPDLRAALNRVFATIPPKQLHWLQRAFRILFHKDMRRRFYPLHNPSTHKDVHVIIVFGMKYEVLSEIFHEELAQAMSRNTGVEVEDAYTAIETFLKQKRKDERTQNRKDFAGHGTQPVYRLAYLDTMSNAYQLQEPAPFDGTFQEKADWVARWQDVVDAEVAKLFPGGFPIPNF